MRSFVKLYICFLIYITIRFMSEQIEAPGRSEVSYRLDRLAVYISVPSQLGYSLQLCKSSYLLMML